MTDSKRESIISAIETAITSTAGIDSRVFRGRPSPARGEETPCIFLSWVNDLPLYDNLSIMDWTLTVRLTVIVRGEDAETLADPIIKSAHSKIMADRDLGGLALDCLPGEQRMDIIEGDKPVGFLQALYVVKYRTDQNALN